MKSGALIVYASEAGAIAAESDQRIMTTGA